MLLLAFALHVSWLSVGLNSFLGFECFDLFLSHFLNLVRTTAATVTDADCLAHLSIVLINSTLSFIYANGQI